MRLPPHRFLLGLLRSCSPMVLIVATLLALVAGWIIAARYPLVWTVEEMRWSAELSRESFYQPKWQPFYARYDRCFDAKGIATTKYTLADINWGTNERPFDVITELRFGYPFKSHTCSITRTLDAKVAVLGGSAIELDDGVLPTNILISGFLANTLTYFVFIMSMVLTWRSLRYTIRASKGRCTHCGYDLRSIEGLTSHCPECGAVIRPQKNPTAQTDH